MSKWKLHFWDWDAPVLVKAVAELMRGWKGRQLDLSHTVIIVPSAEASRRLREALAVAAAKRDGAVMAPHVWHPEIALVQNAGHEKIASALQERLVWNAVLQGIRMEEYPKLFPSPPAVSRETWAAGVAETLSGLRRTTGAGGWSLADVAKKNSDGPDAERWAELARAEQLYITMLSSADLRDAQDMKRQCSQNPVVPQGVNHVQVIALADPTPMLRKWLAQVARKVEVTIWAHAPLNERQRFDDMGVPRKEAWGDAARFVQDLSKDQVHLVSHPQDQAQRAVSLLGEIVDSDRPAAVGLADPTLASALEGALAANGIRAFDPAGRAARQHGLMEVLRVWLHLSQTQSCRALSPLLRINDLLAVFSQCAGRGQGELLETWDDFYQKRLPAKLSDASLLSAVLLPRDDAGKLASLHDLLKEIAARLEAWTHEDAPIALRRFLEWIYGERVFATQDTEDRGYVFLFGELQRLTQEGDETAQKIGLRLNAGQLLQIVLNDIEAVNLPDARGEVDMVLHGWLELLWEPADGLIVCGFNDESVPGKIAPDSFLPDHVREHIGLSCQAMRGARDSYILSAMLAQRKNNGALHLVVGKSNDEGDVLKPSRLLFACADGELAARIHHLFPKETEAAAARQPARVNAWKLEPWRNAQTLRDVNVSLLSSYLRCPLRCYLEKFLKMSAVDVTQREMTPGEFGGLVHEVLAEFGREETLRDSVNPAEIVAFFDQSLERSVTTRWGATPLLSVALQKESARQRLAHFAAVQAGLRAEGWRIAEVEFEVRKESGLVLDGLPFVARIDRIDVHESTKEIRIWDYKTRHRPKSPEDSHSEIARGEMADDPLQQWRHVYGRKSERRLWTDMQLPVYAWALRSIYPDVRITAGYIQLPTAVTECAAVLWEEVDDALIEAACECATEIVRRLKAGVFWPPNEDIHGDAFEELFLDDPSEAVLDAAFWKGAKL